MKKICAILLTLCMVMSLAAVPALAETVDPFVIDAVADAEDHYDNGLNGGNGTLETLYSKAMLRACGEWVSYDISSLTEGTYSVEIAYSTNGINANRTGLDFVVDGELESRSYITTNSGGWNTTATASAGKIYIPAEGAEELKVKNIGYDNISLATVTLTYVGTGDTTDDILIYGINTTVTPKSTNDGVKVEDGTDFYDAGGASKFETQHNAVILRANDWTRYDISDFKAGTYEVTFNRGQSTATTFVLGIDGKDKLQKKVSDSADLTGYTTPADVVLGNIYISEDSEYLTLLNSGSYAAYAYNLKFKYISSEREPVVINSAGVISGGQGVGYYDTSDSKALETFSSNGSSGVIFRPSEWLKYDASNLDAGTYEVTLKRGQTYGTTFALSVDERAPLSKSVTTVTTSYYDYQDVVLGNIYVPEGSDYLTLSNNGSNAAFLVSVSLKYVSSERPLVSINGTGVISGGDGVGYYDAGGAGTLEKQTDTTAILRKNDWLKYDVSDLDAGTYELKINMSSNSTPKVKVDVDDFAYIVKDTANTNGYGNYQDVSLGTIYIGEDTQTIKITNASTGDYTAFVAAVILKYKTEENTAEMYIDINPQSESAKSESNATEEGKYVILRQGGWIRYNISSYGLNPGIYSLRAKVNTLGAVALGVEAEGTDKLRSTPITGATANTSEIEIGKLIIGEASTYFTVSHNDTSADRVLLYALRITDAAEETTVKYTSDAEGNNVITSLDGLTEAYVTVSLIRPGKASIGETVYVVLYGADAQDFNLLEDVQPWPVEDGFEFTKTFKVTDIGANSTIKTFVWDTDTFEPVAGPAIISVTAPV